MDREQIEHQLFNYAQDRDCRSVTAAAWHFNDLLERHGTGPRIRAAKARIEEAVQLALAAIQNGDG